MSDQTMSPYEPGTRVWCKAVNWIWWPGRIVSLKDTPDEFQEYVAEKKKNCIAVVYYESDKTHEPITKMNKLMLYNCPDKMQFLEKGFALYEKQKKGYQIKNNIVMENFLKEAIMAEKDIGGDENIFEKFKKEDEIIRPKINIKDIFVTNKERLKKKKSLSGNNKVPSKFSPIKLSEKSPSQSSGNTRTKDFRTPIQGERHCHGVCGLVGCIFKSSINTDFQMHLKLGREKKSKDVSINVSSKAKQFKLESKATSSKSNNRKHLQTSRNLKKTKKDEAKKMKLEAEILKDWVEDSDDDSQNDNLKVNSNVEAISQNASAIESMIHKVFEFNDNDDNNVANLRNLKSNSSLVENTGSIISKTNSSEISVISISNSVISKWSNVNEIIMGNMSTRIINEEQITGDENLILSDLTSINDRKEYEANAEIKQCVEDSTTANISTDSDPTKSGHSKIFKRDSLPDWVKKENWDTLEHSQFNEAMVWKTRMCELRDLSSMKFEDALKPVKRNMSETAFLNKDIEEEIVPVELEPGYELRTMLIPVDNTVTPLSDEELLKVPFIQKVLKKIEAGDTDDIFVYFPGAKLLPKE